MQGKQGSRPHKTQATEGSGCWTLFPNGKQFEEVTKKVENCLDRLRCHACCTHCLSGRRNFPKSQTTRAAPMHCSAHYSTANDRLTILSIPSPVTLSHHLSKLPCKEAEIAEKLPNNTVLRRQTMGSHQSRKVTKLRTLSVAPLAPLARLRTLRGVFFLKRAYRRLATIGGKNT